MMDVITRFDDLGSDGAQVKLGIMGGTFDPIHMGHLRVAEEVREGLALDGVLFMPTGNPVFKLDKKVTDAETRFSHVVAAIADNPHFGASRMEIDREGNTYTADTLRQMRELYPDNVEFYFIIGSDAAAGIGKWRNAAEIAELAHLAVAVGRPGYAESNELRRAILEAAPFQLHLVQVTPLEISSSGIRDLLAQGKSIRYLVPSSVAQALEANDGPARKPGWNEPQSSQGDSDKRDEARRSDDGLIDPLSKRFFNMCRAELEKRVSPKRLQHSLGVSEACVTLAKCYGVPVKKARLAGLLHDWDKGYDDEGARARVYELHMADEVDPAVIQKMPQVLHGFTAAKALGIEYPQIPADVLQAISRHTTAAVDMSPLDMVLYVADAIEPNRQFGRLDELRESVGKVSLEQLYFETYDYWVFLLLERRRPLHPDTIRIWNCNVERRNGANRNKEDEKKRA